LREATFGLLAALDINRDAPFVTACVREIERLRNRHSHWGTTQDNALALLALGAWRLAVPQEENGDFTAVVTWQGGEGRSGATNAFACAVAGTAATTVSNEGPGTMYVTRRVEGVPLAALPEVSAGISVKREWLTLDGAPLQTNVLTRGDLLVVKLTVNAGVQPVNDVIVEDLLPACLEIECADLRKAGTLPWIVNPATDWVVHNEARDDRMLVFGATTFGDHVYFYSARVVTSGQFTLPAITATRMYAPEVEARTKAGVVTVVE